MFGLNTSIVVSIYTFQDMVVCVELGANLSEWLQCYISMRLVSSGQH